MKHSFTKPITTALLLLPFIFLTNYTFGQITSACEDPEATIINIETGCGDTLNLCIDRESLSSNGIADIYVSENDETGIFSSCDFDLPPDVLLPSTGSIEKMTNAYGVCFVRYTVNDIGLLPTSPAEPPYQDSFEYVLNLVNTCNLPTGYCDSDDGKIWAITSSFYGPSTSSVIVYSKNTPFDTVFNINPGELFEINGAHDGNGNRILPNSNSEWEYVFYSGDDLESTPVFTTSVHTSCSQEIFGIDFGWFRPISGCIASPNNDVLNCNVTSVSSGRRNNVAQVRADEITALSEDTTTVFVEYTAPLLLPIEISTFIGIGQGKTNIITWYVESAVGNDRMILQKSTNGIDFYDVALHSDVTVKRYEYVDRDVDTRRSYYRVKIASQNGDVEYTRMISILNKNVEDATVYVFPNPTNHELNFVSTRDIERVQIFSLTGQLIFNQKFSSNRVELTSAGLDLSPGVYFAKIELENGNLETRKINILK